MQVCLAISVSFYYHRADLDLVQYVMSVRSTVRDSHHGSFHRGLKYKRRTVIKTAKVNNGTTLLTAGVVGSWIKFNFLISFLNS